MKVIFSLSVILLCCTCCIAQNVITDSTATVLAYWKKGDKAKYSLKMTKEKYDNGKKISGGTSVSDIDITVADATDSSYTLYWKYSKITVPGPETGNPVVAKLTRLVEGVTFKYTTEAGGEFKSLINFNEVKGLMNKTLDELLKIQGGKDMQPVIEQTKKVFASKEGVEQLLMTDIQLLHNLYGGEYKLHEALKAETQLPNFLGGNPFPAILTINMTELDKQNKTCIITLNQVVDSEKAAKEVGTFLEKNGKPLNEKVGGLDISDTYSFEVDLITGWMKKAVYTRTASAEGKKNVEIHEIIKL